MNTALAKIEPKAQLVAELERAHPIIPRSVPEVLQLAELIVKAGLCPDSYDKNGAPDVQKIVIGIMKGAEVGLPPITALSTIAIIRKRPCIWGDGAIALVQRTGLVAKVEQTWEGGAETTNGPTATAGGEQDHTPTGKDFPDTMTAVYRIWRVGQELPYEGRFSVKDAKRSHLWGNTKKVPWIEYPKRMLIARARAFALREGFADALSGLSIREEVEDLPDAPAPVSTAFLDDMPAIGVTVDNDPLPAATVAVSGDKPASYADAKAAADQGTVALEVWWKANREHQHELAEWKDSLKAIASTADQNAEVA
jgi:hypothetical protein